MAKTNRATPDALSRGGWKPAGSKTSAVTTAWGVKWDEEAIARDLLQNFYDANRENLDAVKVAVKGHRVEVSAPATFELDRLFYLGSEKDRDENVGQFGEGFKAAALCLVRDHEIEPVVISGAKAVRIRASEEAVRGTDLLPLVYDVFERASANTGTLMILEGCSVKLARAVAAGLAHFWHERNPLVGRCLWKNGKGDTQLYEAAKGAKDGAIFYRRLRRGTVPGIPVVLVIDRECGPIERKTKQDRDRLAFGGDLVEKSYKAFTAGFRSHEREPAKEVLKLSKHLWPAGHSLLSALADRASNNWTDKDRREVFGDPKQWFADVRRQTRGDTADKIVRVEEIQAAWKTAGVIELPGYFVRFGIRTALGEILARDAGHARRARRPPSEAEGAAIEVLRAATEEFAPEIIALFAKKKTEYFVLQGGDKGAANALGKEELLGAYKQSERVWDLREVWLAETLFVGDFSEALATFLHEHAHVLGYDGSRAFTDALTGMLATVVRMIADPKARKMLESLSARWDEATKAVARERKDGGAKSIDSSVKRRIDTLSEDGLRSLLDRVPPAVLRRLLNRSVED